MFNKLAPFRTLAVSSGSAAVPPPLTHHIIWNKVPEHPSFRVTVKLGYNKHQIKLP